MDNDGTVEILLSLDEETNQARKLIVPYMTDEQAEIFFDDIENYFYRQGGEMRECKYCGELFPFFPVGINYDYCFKMECFHKQNEEHAHRIPSALNYMDTPRPEPRLPKPRTPKPPAVRRGSREGFVYLIRAENGRHKIGRARDLEQRRQGLEREIPLKMEIIHHIACSDYIKAELSLHEKYADRRVQYEWFDLSPEQIAEIIEIGDYGLD